jgi:predicted DNA-binding transcriptional regulator YafY
MPKADSYANVERVLRVKNVITDQELSVEQIVQCLPFEVSKRTVQRDIELLQDLNEPITSRGKRPPRYIIRSSKPQMHPIETLVLYSAARSVYHRSGGEIEHYKSVIKRLTNWLPISLHPVLQRANDIDKRSSRESQNLEHVAKGWFLQHRIAFEYQSANGKNGWRNNELEIYFIETQDSGLFAIGKETTFHHKIITLKLSRMRHIRVLTDTHYQIPEEFDPKVFLKNAWGIIGQSDGQTVAVRLKFQPAVLRRLDEGGYAHMKTIRNNPDGTRIVEVIAGTNKEGIPLEILVWVRTWSHNVEVLSPESVRQIWLADARTLLERYDTKKETA